MRRRRLEPDGCQPGRGAAPTKIVRARLFRRCPTVAEATLWDHLRRRNIGGHRFRRQHPVAGFLVDFYCPALRLAIEVDGAIHETQTERDAERTGCLEQLGVSVLRLANSQILGDPEGAVALIHAACGTLALPGEKGTPFPPNGGKGDGG